MRRPLFVLLALLWTALPAQAQPASGPWSRVIFGTDAGPFDTSGTGSPENVVSACPGSTYRQTDGAAGNVFWTKDGGTGCDTTGWIILAGGGGGGSHNLLSATHTDTLAASVVRGSVLVGNSTPAWSRLGLGASGTFLHSDGTDAGWSTNGSALTALNGSNISSGTVPDAHLSANVSLFGAAVDNSEITAATITFAKWASNSCLTDEIPKYNGAAWACATDQSGGGGADAAASYLTRTAEGSLSNESNLGSLTTGLLKITVGAGIATPSTGSAGTDYVAPGAVTSSGLTMATARLLGRTSASPGAIEEISIGAGLSMSAGSITATGTGAANSDRLIGITVDGGAAAITSGVKGFILAPISGTITKVTLLSTDASATACVITFDVFQDTFANYPPVAGAPDSVVASAPPLLTGPAASYQDAGLSGWTTGVTAGHIYGFKVEASPTPTCTRVTLMLTVTP